MRAVSPTTPGSTASWRRRSLGVLRLGAGNMKQLHIHERGAHVVMYNATDRSLFDSYDRFNAIVEELEAKGREDLVRQGLPTRRRRAPARDWTCATATSW